MEAFLEYIMLNYTWFLGGAIIILLAIIGYYADETNFGQGKTKEQKIDSQNKNEIINNIEKDAQNQEQTLQQPIQQVQVNDIQQNELKDENISEVEKNENINQEQIVDKQESILEQSVDSSDNKTVSNNIQMPQTNFEVEFEKFDKEFNEVLPEKEIINDDLLEEIDNLSFDKTQKINVSDILDLDDVELPKIKTMEPEQQDIWKF